MIRLATILFLFGTASVHAAVPDGPTRTFEGKDLFALELASDPQISPDGKTVAYVRRSGDIMTDRMRATIWLVDVASGRQTPLAAGAGNHGQPRWSPDGRQLAYVSDQDGKRQLFVRWMAGGETARVTDLPDAPRELAWSPDGTSIAYLMTVPAEPVKLGAAPAKPDGAQWAPPLEVLDRVNYRNDGGGYVKPGFDHIFLVPATGGASRQLSFGAYNDSGPLSWSPDGRTILFSGVRKADWQQNPFDSEVYALDVASGGVTALTTRAGPDQSPQISPDGRQIAYLGYDDRRRSYQTAHVYLMQRDGSAPRALTADFDRSIETVIWAPDGRSLLIQYEDGGVVKVARLSLTGQVTPLVDAMAASSLDRPYIGGEFSVARTGAIAFTKGSAAAPPDIALKQGNATRQLTRLNGFLATKALGQVQPLTVKAPDGRAVPAWIALPPGYQQGARAPLILEMHGGPHSAYGAYFATDMQLYAAAGYAVLYTNPRGSTSYGDEFANLINRKFPGPDYDDLMAAVDAAVAAGIADPDNLFVTGGSGGGALTAWIVGRTQRFKAAATQKPVVNWTSEALTMDMTNFTSRYWFDKLPWEDQAAYWDRSPLSLVGNVKTPTLVVVGSEDYRTPVSEAEQYYAALQLQNVPTALVKVPGASHGGLAARPSQSAARASAIIAWFDRYRTRK